MSAIGSPHAPGLAMLPNETQTFSPAGTTAGAIAGAVLGVIVVVACVGIIIMWRYRLSTHCCVYTLSQSLSFNYTLPHRLRQKGMLSVLDSVCIKVHSTSYSDDSEANPFNDQVVELTVIASTEGKNRILVMPAIVLCRPHTFGVVMQCHNLF